MSQLFRILFLASTITVALAAEVYPNSIAEEAPPLSPFQHSDDRMADADAVLTRARISGKLAMIVLGASWCHDSMGFVTHTQDPAVAAVIAQKYEIAYMDVGYLEYGSEVIRRFGMPVIYGTPTVLIIDPTSEQLLNPDTMFRWREAAALTSREAAKLLADQPRDLADEPPVNAEHTRLLDEIKAFEAAQSARIYTGFKIIGPMLAGERSSHFHDYWNQLRELRYTITDDLARLRHEARTRAESGEKNISLTYPAYAPFSWE